MPRASAAPRGPFWKHLEFAILEDYDKGEDLANVERDFRLFDELGIHVWRGSFGWDDYEPRRGRFDFDWLHRFCDRAARHHLLLRPYLGYTPEWAAVGRRRDGATWNDPPARLSDWRVFVRAIATALRRHSNVISYEIYSEENTRQRWDGTRDEYARVLAAAREEIRAAAPGVRVVLGGLAWPDPDWVEGVCEATPGAVDAVPFHAYPETGTPDSVRLENWIGPRFHQDFIASTDAACGRRPLWVNEAGFATWKGRTERDQAAWWARAIATFAATPRIEQIGVYEIRDQKPGTTVNGDAANYHLGITQTDRSRKLAFYTVRFLVRFLSADSVRVDDGGITVTAASGARTSLVHHLFQRHDGTRLLVIWSRRGAIEADVALARRAPRATENALDGSGSVPRTFDGLRIRGIRLTPGEPRLFTFAAPRR